MNENKKSGNGIVIALLAAVLVLVAAVGVLSVFLMKSNKDNKDKLEKIASEMDAVRTAGSSKESLTVNKPENTDMAEQLDDIHDFIEQMRTLMDGEFMGEDPSQENDVTIGGGYVIRSTEAISDAYKSGDESGLDDDQKATLKLASDILDEIIEDGMSDYEKELAVFEWIRDNVKHDEGVTIAIPTAQSRVDNPYGVLSNRKAVCVGFATTFRLFMQMLDIDCMVVHSSDLVHSWDLVKLEDDWYHVDVYGDAESKSYNNFNFNDSYAIDEHGYEWNMDFFPAAEGVKYCYAYVNAVPFTNLKDAAKALYELINEGRTGSVSFLLSGDDAYTNFHLLEAMADEASSYIYASELDETCYSEYSGMQVNDDELVFSFTFTNWDDEEDEPGFLDENENMPTDEQYQEAIEAVEKAFEDFYDEHSRRSEWEDEYYSYGGPVG